MSSDIKFSSARIDVLTDGYHGLEIRVPLLQPDEPPVAVVVALAGIAVRRREIVPRIPHLERRDRLFVTPFHNDCINIRVGTVP